MTTPLNSSINENHWVEVSAPSNIALIKYMGKVDAIHNKPTNSSLSWTLNQLKTFVRIKQNLQLTEDTWSAYERADLRPLDLSDKGRSKFLAFFQKLKVEFKLKGFFEIQSANNFPSDCGLASSASSFAALTLAAHQYAQSTLRPKELARLAQKGSGSSCRSFFSPWALWHDQGAEEIQLPLKNLKHMVILCDETKKTVSSSQAHVQVLTSDLFKGRPERAQERLQFLIQKIRLLDFKNEESENFKKTWKEIFEICWNEFWDMHNLFHTSSPAFMYLNAEGMFVLSSLLERWQKNNDGPLITMDAGSNIHLLFRESQASLYELYQKDYAVNFNLWTDAGYVHRKA